MALYLCAYRNIVLLGNRHVHIYNRTNVHLLLFLYLVSYIDSPTLTSWASVSFLAQLLLPNAVVDGINNVLCFVLLRATDYDYTLCHYTEELQHLIYSMARDYMVTPPVTTAANCQCMQCF